MELDSPRPRSAAQDFDRYRENQLIVYPVDAGTRKGSVDHRGWHGYPPSATIWLFPNRCLSFSSRFPMTRRAPYLGNARWPDGFVCPHCGQIAEPFRIVTRPGVLECRACRRQPASWSAPSWGRAAKAGTSTIRMVAAAVEVRHRKPAPRKTSGRMAAMPVECGWPSPLTAAPIPFRLADRHRRLEWLCQLTSLRKRGCDHHAIAGSGDPKIAEQFMPMIHLVFSN
jgi:Transposase zinc-ribbon domain